jgi:hypothetical protein
LEFESLGEILHLHAYRRPCASNYPRRLLTLKNENGNKNLTPFAQCASELWQRAPALIVQASSFRQFLVLICV